MKHVEAVQTLKRLHLDLTWVDRNLQRLDPTRDHVAFGKLRATRTVITHQIKMIRELI